MPDGLPITPKPKKGTVARAAVKRSVVKKATTTTELISTIEQAEEFAESIRGQLVAMINSAALMRANRRRATAIDRVDFEAAYDDLVNATPRPKSLALLGDVCGAFGAGFIGYSINIYTGPGSAHQAGHIAILAGLVLSVLGIGMKYVDPNR